METRTLTNRFAVAAALACLLGPFSFARIGVAEDVAADAWVSKHFDTSVADLPFRFDYDGKPSPEILARFEKTTEREKIDEDRTRLRLRFKDPDTGLVVRCEGVEYHDFPTIEWTLSFKNEGDSDTPIIADVEALDIVLERTTPGAFELHHQKGSRATPTDFQPHVTALEEGMDLRLRCLGGRGSNGVMPYFNVYWQGHGVILAIGWPGQWDIRFQRDTGNRLSIEAGQEKTHFKLHPGEEVRSPLIVLQFYDGSVVDAQNVWRRWMVRHNLPRGDGQLPPTQLVACSSHQFGEMIHANEENQNLFIDRYVEERLGISSWWMDAGWYVNDGSWPNTGTWEVDRMRFPHGLRAVTDHAHSKGLKSIVWFEPERVTAGTWLYEQHPEWLLAPPPNPGDQLYDEHWRLLNLGNPDARAWLIDHISQIIDREGIDLYRQDFNVDPLLFWRSADAKDRQGITENKYVAGYLAYWDALLARHPALRIDTCASGGRRLDLETLRRSVPQIRSDYLFEPDGQQCHTYGISNWLPYHGTGTLIGKSAIGQDTTDRLDPYDFRSQLACSVTACWDMRDRNLDYDGLRRLTGQLREASPNFLGDYYPLTPYSVASDVWMAWQYDRPEQGTGVVQAFRRQDNSQDKQTFRLHGLDANAQYLVRNVDSDDEIRMTGAELLNRGLTINLPTPRSAALLMYRKADVEQR